MDMIIYMVALATTIGNMLQGWHGGAIAGALLYLKMDFNLEEKPTFEGLIVASAILGAFISTLCAGPLADWIGRKTVLNISAILYSVGAAVMAWSPNAYVLIMGRFLTGAAVGFASAISPLYISESSPPEIRGKLLTFPQMFGSIGMCLAYSLAFGVSLMAHPNWRMMLGITLFPSVLYFALCTWYIPESPRWLVNKGKMLDAKKVLRRLRNKDDITAELALLVEGLGYANETIEEYILRPADRAFHNITEQEGHIEIIRPDNEGLTWIATSITNREDEVKGLTSRAGSLRTDNNNHEPHKFLPLDPVVTFMGSLQASPSKDLDLSGSFKGVEDLLHFDEENLPLPSPMLKDCEMDDQGCGQFDADLAAPLLSSEERKLGIDTVSKDLEESLLSINSMSPYSNTCENGYLAPLGSLSSFPNGSIKSMANESFTYKSNCESLESSTTNIGGGWQLAWQWSHEEGGSSEFKRVFLHQEGVVGSSYAGSMTSLPKSVSKMGSGQHLVLQASALVGTPAQSLKNLLAEGSVGPAMVHPSRTAPQGPAWAEIMEPGVRRALFIGCMLQFLQQFSGLNAVLYYTPQILQASGAEGLLSNLSKDSTSLLASALSGFLMIPFTLWAVRLMDTSGRRTILLYTLPILSMCLFVVILISCFLPEGLLQASLSFLVMVSFICCFVMGFGPIPNILCAEIFPTRVRGLCNGICSATMWLSTVFITYGFPATVSKIGLNGVLAIFALVSLISWVFVYMKVPETKGMPLEVISELFAFSATSINQHGSSDEGMNEEVNV